MRLLVKELAEQRGITKAALARMSGLGTTTIYQLWNADEARAQSVQISTLVAVAHAIGVEWRDLVDSREYTEDNKNAGMVSVPNAA
jgi:transcriptional regulator with XRE-family HTH domain